MKDVIKKYRRMFKGIFISLSVLILFLGVFFSIQYFKPNQMQDFSRVKINVTEREKEGIKQNPADNSSPTSSSSNESVTEVGSTPLAAPNVDNLQKEPLTGERLKQYRLLQNSLHIQQEIYIMMINAKDKETDPAVKVQVEKDIAVIEQKIQEIQKELDKFHQ